MKKTSRPASLRAIAGLTDAVTGLPMADVSRVRVLVRFPGDDEWLDAAGALFGDACGVYQYFPHEAEYCHGLLVCFSGVGTAEGSVVVEATDQRRLKEEEGAAFSYGRDGNH